MDNRNLHSRLRRTARHEVGDAWGLLRLEIGGVTLAPQGFARGGDGLDLLAECAELNRQAVLPPPETLAGKSVKEIAAGVRW